VAVPVSYTTPAWHHHLYDYDPTDSEPANGVDSGSGAGSGKSRGELALDPVEVDSLLPSLPIYGHSRSGYEMPMNDEPSSEFAALHIVENDFEATPLTQQQNHNSNPSNGAYSRQHPTLFQHSNSHESVRCLECASHAHLPSAHQQQPRVQQQQQPQHHRRRSSGSSQNSTGSAPAGPDIYASTQVPPSYVVPNHHAHAHGVARGREDSCVIS